jgi:two-component system, NarL family, response regulator DevR
MSAEAIRLLLVDDHAASREPLAILLDRQNDLEVVEQAGSLAETRKLIAAGVVFDIAIVELNLGNGSGVELIREICNQRPEADVMVLTGIADERLHGCAILAGASGIIVKTATTSEVIAAIRKLAAGEPLIPPAEAAALLERGKQFQREAEGVRCALEQLSPREREVLHALTEGLSNEAIAAQMCISLETVRSHVVRILQKLGASSRLQAAILAIRHGFDSEADRPGSA